MSRKRAFYEIQRDMGRFSDAVLAMPLREYQTAWANHALAAACNHENQTIAVEMSRQSGKNETCAHVETAILARMAGSGGSIVKTAPTWRPQIVNSKRRLEARARQAMRRLSFLRYRGTQGYIIECGNADVQFLSAAPTSAVVGATASLLLEVDEAQDVDRDKFDKEFSPMRASTGAPVLVTGTTWTDDTLLARFIAELREGRTQGRYYRIPWDIVAEEVPDYGEYVESEIRRLGADHPIIRTQYLLLPIEGAGRLFSDQQLRLMVGRHARRFERADEPQIVAGLDFAGADEQAGDMEAMLSASSRDSVALTIGAVEWVEIAAGIIQPALRILDRYEWINQRPDGLHAVLVGILRDRWRVDRVHCDATGIGETGTAFLHAALPAGVVHGVKFDSAWSAHTRLTFRYIAQVNRGHLLDYAPGFDAIDAAKREEADPQDVTKRAWWQRGHARLEARPGKKVRVSVPENEGHDDLPISEMLMIDAAYEAGQPVVSDHLASAGYTTWR